MAKSEISASAELHKILLVEDSSSSAMLVQAVFANTAGMHGQPVIVHVTSLQDALAEMEKNQQEPFDIVLLDLTLPDSVGLETLYRFREQFGDVPVVVLTGTGDEVRGFEAVARGAQDFLFKDETYPKLLVRQTIYARQRKLQELALRDARDRAERMTGQKDKFLSMVSHDLRSPLSGIISMLRIIDTSWESLPEERRQRYFKQVQSTAEGMLQVVENLLEISRLQRGLECPRMGFLDAHYLVEEIVARLRSTASVKGVKLNNNVPEHTRVFADGILLGQVIQNLVGNAIKFSYPEGEVDVFVSDGVAASLVVRDRGTGIEPERVRTLFDLGAKATTLGTAGEKGTGLGLAHSHEVMKVMDGELSVQSEAGKGSQFFVRLPLRRPRVMAVDDDPALLRFLEQVIGAIDVEFATAGCAAEAVEVLAEGPRPDLILVDLNLPGAGGLELLADLKRNAATAAIPVVVITGDTSIGTREKAINRGASDFLTKPLAIEDLIPRVRRFIA